MKTIILAGISLAAMVHPMDTAVTAIATADANVEVVRKATAAYRDIEVARADGWSAQLTGCMESMAGGMGYHFGNEKLIADGGQLDPTLPEALLYEPKADGTLELVAVEYLIPFGDWDGQESPVFMDHDMIPNHEFGVWTLHLWLKGNPHGSYEGWNPRVSCAYATTEGR